MKQEGWIHHIVRNALSMFLTRGDLWLNWEPGYQLFMNYLIDAGIYQIPNAQYQMPKAKYQIPNAKYQIPNTKCQIPNTKYQIQNAKYQIAKFQIPNIKCQTGQSAPATGCGSPAQPLRSLSTRPSASTPRCTAGGSTPMENMLKSIFPSWLRCPWSSSMLHGGHRKRFL